MNIKLKNRKLLSFVYIVIAIIFFTCSLKLSGAEAYHQAGVVTYVKWTILGLLLNIGYIIPVTKLGRKLQIVVLAFMVLATIINALIYNNPLKALSYKLLGVILFFISTILILERFFEYGKDLYAKRRS